MPLQEVTSGRLDEIDIIAVGWFLSRYKYWVLTAAVAGAAAAIMVGLVMTPVYRAEVSITPVRNKGMGGASPLAALSGLATIAGVNLGVEAGEGEESRAVLESRHMIELFISRNDLLAVVATDKKEPTLWLAVERFHNDILEIRTDPLKGVTTVSIDWPDAEIAARWANGFVDLANEVLRERALTESKRNVEYLYRQIDQTTVVDLKRVMYNLLETEQQRLMLANGQKDYAFAIVDPAVAPERQVKPRIAMMAGLGLLFGVLAGVVVAFSRKLALERRAWRSGSL